MYHLKNFSEAEVDTLLDITLNLYDNICKCEKCKMDIKAITLNSLSPKYTVSDIGEKYMTVFAEINRQRKVDVTAAITKAIEIVSANPKH